jgi:hypothetical protein
VPIPFIHRLTRSHAKTKEQVARKYQYAIEKDVGDHKTTWSEEGYTIGTR